MPYGAKGAVGGTAALAATGFGMAGWLIGAVTLIFLGIALIQLVRPAPALRP
jgi:hypothetical protein